MFLCYRVRKSLREEEMEYEDSNGGIVGIYIFWFVF